MTKIHVASYGKSMYGGWYANADYVDERGRYVGERWSAGTHTETLRDLKEWAKANDTELRNRWDND